jgi:cellulose synthase/poly-beta-1,6-N-acetylglucosamine synthase-like glycosyltransferase
LSAVFLAISLFAPKLLAPLNKLWFWFGLALHAVINPIVMALIFVITVIPTGLVLRAFGKDPLRLKRAPLLDSYWIRRNPPGPETGSMSKQF